MVINFGDNRFVSVLARQVFEFSLLRSGLQHDYQDNHASNYGYDDPSIRGPHSVRNPGCNELNDPNHENQAHCRPVDSLFSSRHSVPPQREAKHILGTAELYLGCRLFLAFLAETNHHNCTIQTGSINPGELFRTFPTALLTFQAVICSAS